ncbi:MAG: hypothetical protein ACP5N1_03290 [Candidatus Woesearchaeota archaeon]
MVLSDEQKQGLLNDFQKQVRDYVTRIIDSGESLDTCMNPSILEDAVKKNITLPFEDRLGSYRNLTNVIERLNKNCVISNIHNKDIENIARELSTIRINIMSDENEYDHLWDLNNLCNNYANKLVTGVCSVIGFTSKSDIDKICEVMNVQLTEANLYDVVIQMPHFNGRSRTHHAYVVGSHY